jgi:hypothetical protein
VAIAKELTLLKDWILSLVGRFGDVMCNKNFAYEEIVRLRNDLKSVRTEIPSFKEECELLSLRENCSNFKSQARGTYASQESAICWNYTSILLL